MLPLTTLASYNIAEQVLDVVVFTEIQPTVERVVHFPVVTELFALLTRRFDAAVSCKQRRTRGTQEGRIEMVHGTESPARRDGV